MPHIILEYSSNIAERLDAMALLKKLHDGVAAHDIKSYKIKSRLRPLDDYIIGDENAANSMLHLELLVLAGLGKEFTKRIAERLFEIMKNHVEEQKIENCFLTQEAREMDPEIYFRDKTRIFQ